MIRLFCDLAEKHLATADVREAACVFEASSNLVAAYAECELGPGGGGGGGEDDDNDNDHDDVDDDHLANM